MNEIISLEIDRDVDGLTLFLYGEGSTEMTGMVRSLGVSGFVLTACALRSL